MKKYQDFLVESFNTKPAKWERKHYSKHVSRYEFVIEGILYRVMFESYATGYFTISFKIPSAEDMYGMTGTGNQYLVLITVIDCIRDFAKQKIRDGTPVQKFLFSAENRVWDEDIQDYRKLARPQVYKRLIKKFLPDTYYLERTMIGQDTTTFHILKSSE